MRSGVQEVRSVRGGECMPYLGAYTHTFPHTNTPTCMCVCMVCPLVSHLYGQSHDPWAASDWRLPISTGSD